MGAPFLTHLSVLVCREMETEFFARHAVFRKVSPSLLGVAQLSKKLTVLLVERIKHEMVRTQSALFAHTIYLL